MGDLVEQRRKEWKKRFLAKVKSSKDVHEAIGRLTDEYIYYSKDRKDLKKRIVVLQGFIMGQLKSRQFTRKDIGKKDTAEILRELSYLRRKLRKL